MISNRFNYKQKIEKINTYTTRRLQTEHDQCISKPTHLWQQTYIKNNNRSSSRNKYHNAIQKNHIKNNNQQQKNYKISNFKSLANHTQRIIRTQPDQNLKNIATNSITTNYSQFLQKPQEKYQIQGTVGKGTFGVVFVGKNKSNGAKIAVKKVLQDRKYKNRQLSILKVLKHPCILEMKDHYMTTQGNNQYLNVIMDFYRQNLYQVIRRKQMSSISIKIYMYQMLRGLNYLSILGIAHRDIKPHNVLIDRLTHKAVICDFGSAKQLIKGQPNLAYICSRCYRAPQLIFGATDYTTQIDMWSLGCVFIQMINGQHPFIGDNQMDQLIQIIKILGTPQWQQVYQMNSKYSKKQFAKFPLIKKISWNKVIKTRDQTLLDFVINIMQYSPKRRFTAIDALCHKYFDDLRDQDKMIQIHKKIGYFPDFFNFSYEQKLSFGPRKNKLIPEWYKKTQKSELRHNLKSKDKPSSFKNSVTIKNKILQKIH